MKDFIKELWDDGMFGRFVLAIYLFLLVALVSLPFLIHSAVAGDHSEPPSLVVEQDGVRVWRAVTPRGQVIYFTTPGGDVEWTVLDGKVVRRRSVVSGVPASAEEKKP